MSITSRKALVQLTKDGQVIKVWSAINEAATKLVIDRRNIQAVLRGEREYAGGYQWQLAEGYKGEQGND